jgi:hypothetical protein
VPANSAHFHRLVGVVEGRIDSKDQGQQEYGQETGQSEDEIRDIVLNPIRFW